MTGRCRAVARIRLTVEVAGSTYGPEWKLGDINKQAGEEAVQAVQNKLADLGVRVIGEPVVTTVLVTEER